jgi:hypothetical protein
MPGRIFRRVRGRKRKEEPVTISPLRERARAAAEAIHADNSARWFPLNDIFPIYNYLYDYYRGNREDTRLRTLAHQAIGHLVSIAERMEVTAINRLPPEWDEAKAALAEAAEVFRAITRAW